MMNLADFAYDLLDLVERNQRLEAENAELREYRDKYIELLHSDIKHNENMMGGFFGLLLKPGVAEAIQSAPIDS